MEEEESRWGVYNRPPRLLTAYPPHALFVSYDPVKKLNDPNWPWEDL